VPRKKKLLTPQQLVYAYANGYFPMADSYDGRVYWYSPQPRAIIPLETYKPQRSLRPVLNQGIFEVHYNTVFEKVIRGCALMPRSHESGTWISEEIIEAYLQLHWSGLAHSVEAFKEGILAGGLYGVAMGGAFFGESMFHNQPNASKVAFHYLMERLKERGFRLLDTQFINDNVKRYGAIEISKEEYLIRLQEALQVHTSFA
jgi:leucyl/phenylalanyl-tRNA--protein transferase